MISFLYYVLLFLCPVYDTYKNENIRLVILLLFKSYIVHYFLH